MQLLFFQRLLDHLQSRVAIINNEGRVLLVSALANRQFGLVPGAHLEVLHREGDRVLILPPATQQLHSAISLRWLKFDFLLFQGRSAEAVEPTLPAGSATPGQNLSLAAFCASPALQSQLVPEYQARLQRLLADTTRLGPETDPSGATTIAAEFDGMLVEPLRLIELAFGPRMDGVSEFFVQAPKTIGMLHGDITLLASALRSLVINLVSKQSSSRLLVRLHQIDAELLITIQDIGALQLPGMTRLGTQERWHGQVLRSAEACEVVERHGGQMRLRGDMAQGRITISLPVAIKSVFE